VSLIIGNSAGMVVGGGGITQEDKEEIADLVLNSGVLTEYAFLDETFVIKRKIQQLM
jgi:hypothetical protein